MKIRKQILIGLAVLSLTTVAALADLNTNCEANASACNPKENATCSAKCDDQESCTEQCTCPGSPQPGQCIDAATVADTTCKGNCTGS